ncbi:hypothetical protein D0Z07_7162 [Hyphodiscus hymeniophilus]|uniref:Uncharacterized protein n=1 Tax=Hyphodiscus hymeniophilus TaxID=353542 RepID=A0A9P6VGJ0_9HELO|nr:hypothetical protein D0Z07_7162 [Hyphodiscus hymeniophilus]
MQFTLITLLSLVAFAFASPVPGRLDDLVARSAPAPPAAEAAAMSDANGNVVAFSSSGVYQGMH